MTSISLPIQNSFRYRTSEGTVIYWFTNRDRNLVPKDEVIRKIQELVPIDHARNYMVSEGLGWRINIYTGGVSSKTLQPTENGHAILGLEKHIFDGSPDVIKSSYPVFNFQPIPTIPPVEESPKVVPESVPVSDVLSKQMVYPTVDFINLLVSDVAKRLGVHSSQVIYNIETKKVFVTKEIDFSSQNIYCYLLGIVSFDKINFDIIFKDKYLSDKPINGKEFLNGFFFNSWYSIGEAIIYYIEFSCK